MLGHKASIRTPMLDCNSLSITAYNAAALANNADLSSQPGRVVLLTDDNRNFISVSYKSYRSRRIALTALHAEVNPFADLFHNAIAIRKHLEFVLRQTISVHILTDSKSLFDIIS